MTMVCPRSSRAYPDVGAAASHFEMPPEYPSTVASVAGEPVLTPLKRASMPLPRRMKRKKTQGFLDGDTDFFRRLATPRVKTLSKRQKVQDKIGQNAGATADVTSVIQNLAF